MHELRSNSGVQQQEGGPSAGPVEGAGEQQTVAQEMDDMTAPRPSATEPRHQEQLAAAATRSSLHSVHQQKLS
eukprot:SM000234S07886  [mRNA]  locus=s234:27158:27376:+ [translate_table: standard]